MSIMDVLLLARIWWVLEILGQSELCGLEEYAISQNFEMCTCQIVTIGCWLVIYQTSFIFRRLTIIFNIGQENKNRLNLVLNSNSQIRAKSRDTQVWWNKTHGLFEVFPNVISANHRVILGVKTWRGFALFHDVLFCYTLLFIMFCCLCFTSLVSFTGFYTEDEPNYPLWC